jgi:YegS/Rv2252/BmrU family lipid kinase
MNLLFIINPTSGQHRAEQLPSHLSPLLSNMAAAVHFTEGRGDAESVARNAAINGSYDGIIVVGGDGTVNEVVNGIVHSPSNGSHITIGIVPMGTSNILATELGIPIHALAEHIEIIKNAHRRKIDVGIVDERCFTMMASYGFDAEAVKHVQPQVKDFMGAPAYILSGMAALAKYNASKVVITIDDERIESEAFVVVVANTSAYAVEHVKIAPFAAIDDGWLDVCIFERPPNDKIGFLGQILLLMARRHLGDPRVRYYRGKTVSVEATPPMLGQIDGDPARSTPVKIDIRHRAVNFFVP